MSLGPPDIQTFIQTYFLFLPFRVFLSVTTLIRRMRETEISMATSISLSHFSESFVFTSISKIGRFSDLLLLFRNDSIKMILNEYLIRTNIRRLDVEHLVLNKK
ncbi:hypothetical protein CEXT_432791 [Caerostris extrusa]|uniref:Uncharacterized protein n=1 Tax=Caerostris extrusa TaxID=172846 RepID=A0AAV4WVB0_CAEEX|nr:hypothetical protein CEXT_432791 [Caerostris extrusa]